MLGSGIKCFLSEPALFGHCPGVAAVKDRKDEALVEMEFSLDARIRVSIFLLVAKAFDHEI